MSLENTTPIAKRLSNLEEHLKEENDFLAEVIPTFRKLDAIAYKLGLLNKDQHSYVTRISWWPIISVLGTFSAGKSTFINHYLENNLQRTGNQAVDDKFTVICYNGENSTNTTLPGLALDADERLPFYEISRELGQLTGTPGQRADTYLQMKTGFSKQLRGKILIDSPGFDADDQRTTTLRGITQHIIDLSDLVLVFFDARHAEPGAMRDTLNYLVRTTIDRADSNKFLYILNQIDVTAREDNPEEVIAAWQRSLAQAGLTAGRFYRIYNPEVAMPFEDPQVKERFEKKAFADLSEIHRRMDHVSMDRAYRLTGMLEHSVKEIEDKLVPTLQELIQRWKKRVFWTETVLGVGLIALASMWFAATGTGSDLLTALKGLSSSSSLILLGIFMVLAMILHLKVTKKAAHSVIDKFKRNKEMTDNYARECVVRAFQKNTCLFRSLFIWLVNEPIGWSQSSQQRLREVLNDLNRYIQSLNNRFTNPSGKKTEVAVAKVTTKSPAPAPISVAAG